GRQGADVDDCTAGRHALGDRLHPLQRTERVDLHDTPEVLGCEISDTSAVGDAGAVEQSVDPLATSHQVMPCVDVGNVEAVFRGVGDVGGNDGRALTPEHGDRRGADATACAGDDDDPAGHGLFSRHAALS